MRVYEGEADGTGLIHDVVDKGYLIHDVVDKGYLFVTRCDRDTNDVGFYAVPNTQLVTCLQCVARMGVR